MFGRKYELDLYEAGSGKPKTITDLDVRFTIRNNCNFIADAKIEICNPTRDIIDKFSAAVLMYKESSSKRRVTLRVGWADENDLRPIFDGVVMTALPSSYPPDIWLSMNCIGFAYADTSIPLDNDEKTISFTKSGLTFADVIANLKPIVEKVGLKIDSKVSNTDITKKEIGSFTSDGTVRSLMRHVKEIDKNLELYSSGTTIFIKDVRDKVDDEPRKIDKDTGMIGLPRCNWPMYYVETFMRTDIELWSNVSVTSSFKIFYKRGDKDMMGSLEKSGSFRVMGITYTGQFRSGKWAMTLDLLQLNRAMADRNLEMKKLTDTKTVKGMK